MRANERQWEGIFRANRAWLRLYGAPSIVCSGTTVPSALSGTN